MPHLGIIEARKEARVIAVIGSRKNEGTERLVRAWKGLGLDVALMSGSEALAALGPGDVALGRLDVLDGLDGVEDGVLAMLLLARRGVHVLNPAEALLAAHDKLRTAQMLVRAGLPHPATVHVSSVEDVDLQPPVVVKPRFGSWGVDVVLCADADELRARLGELSGRPWFRRHGALVQEALPAPGHDLRVLVAAGSVVGAAERVAAPGEWRTNISCGGSLRPAEISELAAELARTAASAIGADFVGVDLLPLGDGRYVVLELNAAVDFDATYSFDEGDVHAAIASALGLLPLRGHVRPPLRSVLAG